METIHYIKRDLLNTKYIISLFFGLYLLLALQPHVLFVFVIWALMGLLSLTKPQMNLIPWIMLLPLEYFITDQLGYSIYMGHTSLLLVGGGLNIISDSNLKNSVVNFFHDKRYLTVFIALVVIMGYHSLFNIRAAISLGLLLLSAGVIAFFILKDKLHIILLSIFASSLIGSFVGIVLTDNSWRISINGNVRVLSNSLGLSLVFLSGLLIDRTTVKLAQDNKKKNFIIGTLIFLYTAILFATVSRGVLVAVIIPVLGMSTLRLVNLKEMPKLSLKKIFIGLVTLISSFYLVRVIDSIVTNGQIARRFNLDMFDNVRFNIWRATFEQISWLDWLVGTGFGNFRDLALQAGYDFYSHSVFVDILISFGIGVLLLLIIFISIALVHFFMKKEVMALGITIYTITSYFTHGSISSKYFWLTFAIVIGLYLNSKRDLPETRWNNA